jgi:hypothetical protein
VKKIMRENEKKEQNKKALLPTKKKVNNIAKIQ